MRWGRSHFKVAEPKYKTSFKTWLARVHAAMSMYVVFGSHGSFPWRVLSFHLARLFSTFANVEENDDRYIVYVGLCLCLPGIVFICSKYSSNCGIVTKGCCDLSGLWLCRTVVNFVPGYHTPAHLLLNLYLCARPQRCVGGPRT